MFTRFMDMSSGGSRKEQWNQIYIESPNEAHAKSIFYNRFGHNPDRVSCTCCGPDYSISSYDTLEEATRYDRNDYEDSWNSRPAITLEEYEKQENVLILRDTDITEDQYRLTEIPEQGYVWR